MYYYTAAKGTYRKSKTTIDILILIMAAVVVALFVSIIFWQSMRSMLFPMIFVSSAIVNALHAIKNFINSNKKAGIVLTGVAIMLIILATVCWSVTSRTL